MTMNSNYLVSLVLGLMPLSMTAQDDDMYFVPSKQDVQPTVYSVHPTSAYNSGNIRDVDEYNRRGGSYYEPITTDSAGNDIVNFDAVRGVYPDSLTNDTLLPYEDFELTRQMSRWDGYEPTYMDGYRDGSRDSWMLGWHSPWYYSSFYPWYDAWYDPWYGYHGWYGRYYGWYGSYYGWYDPWYYGYYPYGPYYGGYYYGPYYGYTTVYNSGPAGTTNHGNIRYNGPHGISNGRSTTYSAGTFGGRSVNRSGNFGGSRNVTSRNTGTRAVRNDNSRSPYTTNRYGNFGGNRSNSTYNTRTNSGSSTSNTRTYTPTPTRSSSSSSGSFGSFGGSRSSGGSFGGGGSRSSGGGGHFGGRR